jgi:hypothetical protein
MDFLILHCTIFFFFFFFFCLQAIQRSHWFTHFSIHGCTCTRILSLHQSLLGSGSKLRNYHLKLLWSLLVISFSITLEYRLNSPVSVLRGSNLYLTDTISAANTLPLHSRGTDTYHRKHYTLHTVVWRHRANKLRSGCIAKVRALSTYCCVACVLERVYWVVA